MSLLKYLDFKKLNHVTIFCDNEDSIKLAYNPVFHSRTKHITTYYHFVREKVESGEIQVQHLPTTEQTTNLLTKPLGKKLFAQGAFGKFPHGRRDGFPTMNIPTLT